MQKKELIQRLVNIYTLVDEREWLKQRNSQIEAERTRNIREQNEVLNDGGISYPVVKRPKRWRGISGLVKLGVLWSVIYLMLASVPLLYVMRYVLYALTAVCTFLAAWLIDKSIKKRIQELDNRDMMIGKREEDRYNAIRQEIEQTNAVLSSERAQNEERQRRLLRAEQGLSQGLITEKYRTRIALATIIEALYSGRADDLKEALNIYVEEEYRGEVIGIGKKILTTQEKMLAEQREQTKLLGMANMIAMTNGWRNNMNHADMKKHISKENDRLMDAINNKDMNVYIYE